MGGFEGWVEFVWIKLDRSYCLTQLKQKHEESKSQDNLNGYENLPLTLAFNIFHSFNFP